MSNYLYDEYGEYDNPLVEHTHIYDCNCRECRNERMSSNLKNDYHYDNRGYYNHYAKNNYNNESNDNFNNLPEKYDSFDDTDLYDDF